MEKSDKKSIIIACVFLVILLACLGFVTYIKMTYDVKDNNINNNTTIDTPVLLSLDNIIASFNNSQLVSDYYALGTTVAMEKTNTGFNVTYSSDQENDVIEGTYVEYILSIKFNKDNVEMANSIFKELVNISCKNNGYTEGQCNETVDEFLNNSYAVDGLVYEEISDTEMYLRVNTAVKIELFVGPTTYKANDLIDININEYIINNNIYKLSNPLLNYDSANNTLTYKANVQNLLDSGNNVKIELKLYDASNNLLMTNEVDNSASTDKNNFDILFNMTLDNSISYENIKYLSINFINE